MMSEKLKNITKEDWRKLGFYYERDDKEKKWVFVGSKYGLEDFCIILNEYSENKNNEIIGEHIHLGPYEYLKIMTSDHFKVTEDWICGSLQDLKKLSSLIKEEIKITKIDTIKIIENDFFQESDFLLELRVMQYGYDPATADIQLWE
ncbi:MAG: hypothetical protein JXR70_03755 [Spirochaetales bacterium]|nr:hypothetical protein [Spirochaetales bacterium]